MPAKKMGNKGGNTPRGFLPPDDPVYYGGPIVGGILSRISGKVQVVLEPQGYTDFLTKVLDSLVAVSPDIFQAVEQHGFTLHPDAKDTGDFDPKKDLPDEITVRCYGTGERVIARFRVFLRKRTAKGHFRTIRLKDRPKKPE